MRAFHPLRTLLLLLPVLLAACHRTPTEPTAQPDTSDAAPESEEPIADPALRPWTQVKGDKFDTSKGPLTIMPLNHASFMMSFVRTVIAIDPTRDAYRDPDLPRADYVFVTDVHRDHLDKNAIDRAKTHDATLVGPPAVVVRHGMTRTLANGQKADFGLFSVEAVPMYNLVRGPRPGELFHDKGRGDGYVFTFGDKRVYVSGDTECTPEVRDLKNIDIAFVCMNEPFTMPVAEAAACVRAFKPKIVYPYHYRGQDPKAFAALLAGSGIEVRLRDWYAGAPPSDAGVDVADAQ